jgi:hypothetical protein
MSVKFEKDTVKSTVGAAAKEVGTALTGGKSANGYLAVSPHRRDIRMQLTVG